MDYQLTDRFPPLFDNAPISIGLTTLDGKIMAANPSLLNMLGYTEAELCERNVGDLYADPEVRFELLEQLSTSTVVNNFGVKLKRKDGSSIFVNLNVSKMIHNGDEVLLTILEDVSDQVRLTIRLEEEIKAREQTERELYTQIELVDNLLDHAMETVEIIDANTLEHVKWNKTLSQITGYSDDEIAAMDPIADFIYEADIANIEAALEKLFRDGQATVNASLVHKDGHLIPIDYTGGITRDPDGNPLNIIAIGRDITERLGADKQLRFQSHLLESVVQAVIVTDLSGQVIYWNPFAEKLYGWSAEDVLGQRTNELMVDDYNQQINEEIMTCINAGKSWSGELTMTHKDGKRFPVHSTVTPVADEQGDLHHIIGVSYDITENKQAEEARQKSEEAYRNLVERVSDVIYAADAEGTLTYLNPAAEILLGLSLEEVVGQSFEKFIHPEDLTRAQNNSKELLSGKTPDPAEYRIRNAMGETRWILVKSQPAKKNGTITGFQGVLVDITNQKILEAQIKEQATSAERQRLAIGLHDTVTQSLYSINLQSDATLMAISSGNNEVAKQRLGMLKQIAQDAMSEMRLLIHQLHPPIVEEVGLALALQQRLDVVETRAGISVDLQVEGDQQLPLDIENALFYVASEGLNNILQHANASEIQIRLILEVNRCQLSIQDNGVGFEPESIKNYGGYGLANMRDRLQKINGTLTINSQPDKGTTLDIEVIR